MALPLILLAGQSNAARVSDEVAAALDDRYGAGGYLLVAVHAAGAPLTRDRAEKDDWFNRDELPDALAAQTIAALSARPDARVAGLIWVQGEGDTHGDGDPAAYGAAFHALRSGLRDRVVAERGPGTGIDSAGAVVAALSDHAPQAATRANWAAVATAQADLAAPEAVRVVDPDSVAARAGLAPGAMFADPLHYSDAMSDLLARSLVAELPPASDFADPPRDLRGGAGDDLLSPSPGGETITSGGGHDRIGGTAAELAGDTITDFGATDRLVVEGGRLGDAGVTIGPRKAVVALGGGAESVKLLGDFREGGFILGHDGRDSTLVFANALPRLAEGQAVPRGEAAGLAAQELLTGTGRAAFRVVLEDGGAAFDNALGVYEVTPEGRITEVRMLFADTGAAGRSAVVAGVEDGNRLGFFLVQDGAGWLAARVAGDDFRFVDADGGTAALDDGDDLRLTTGSGGQGPEVFHAFDAALNRDGLQHALAGVKDGDLFIGFEDMTGGGDRDFQDAVIRVEMVDEFLF